VEGIPPGYEQNPVILNRSGVQCLIVAKSGKTTRGTTRSFLCSSRRWTDVFGSTATGRGAEGEPVHWQITWTEPTTGRDSTGWAQFPVCFLTVHNPPSGPSNVWPFLYRPVRNTFGKGSRVWIGAHVLGD
jgi:hypothetical protein